MEENDKLLLTKENLKRAFPDVCFEPWGCWVAYEHKDFHMRFYPTYHSVSTMEAIESLKQLRRVEIQSHTLIVSGSMRTVGELRRAISLFTTEEVMRL